MLQSMAKDKLKIKKVCPYCGKSIFWIIFWDSLFSLWFGLALVTDLSDGLIAHTDCHEKNQEAEG
jgi:hypothetical protein